MRNKNTKRKRVPTNQREKTKRPNYHLWQARKRRGLRLKQVALLLGHRTYDQICRYERNFRTPSLSSAIKLELIYGVPVRRLFSDITKKAANHLQQQINAGSCLSVRHAGLAVGLRHATEYCTYEEKLKRQKLTALSEEKIRRHIVSLAKKLHGLDH